MTKHPDARLTLREAFERHYDKEDLSRRTIQWYSHAMNLWERLTGNPPIGTVTNETLAEFRRAALESGLQGFTVNRYWTGFRAVLRRMGPPMAGNPRALGIIDLVPWMKPCKVRHKVPKRVPLEDLSRFYLACRHARFPRTGFPPAYYWQALVVLAYFTGLRKSDLMTIRKSDFDLESRTLFVAAQKTGKEMCLPLTDVVIEHVLRIWGEHELLLPAINTKGGDYCARWHAIRRQAGVDHFTLHDVRRTAASEIDRVRPGMASVLLQHAPSGVTARFYLNMEEELREAVEQMRVPLAFAHGPKQAERREERDRREREEMMRRAQWQVPQPPDPDEWSFDVGGFRFRSEWYSMPDAAPLRVLKVLATAGRPVSLFELAEAVFGMHCWPREFYRFSGRVCGCVSVVRSHLCRLFDLPRRWNPVPCVERGKGGKWSLLLPPLAEVRAAS